MNIASHKVVDAKGLSCPMPIVRTKKAIEELDGGQVLEVQATDKGSKADIKAWAESAGHQYLGTIEQEGLLIHYVRKASEKEEKEVAKHPNVIQNDELEQLIKAGENIEIIDVREEAEYVFGHIPGAKSIPFGELEENIDQIDSAKPVYVVCRTGNRSDFAAQMLTEKGMKNVINVIPGMTGWKGSIEKKQ
ncbi:sulfurtransferase TusA family protein [Bacillus aquiflavi]|uniref:Sulfurtransferase TusA family protein n=1 Tax=Bacillus aquiflavi TaxID=2672567 RepID=A0A6B3W280_9BACI|nr:sulfurtransferase TusA family protein [Bacillus aquiflavi]MBA4537734.1 sulfurtransferase TusA family protein [Bacillus aquiflavi]NEY81991.1 hypothetical protein [Bacillus aquiflavi]UAC49884.1 sulfurtransferase TusA family protein [Bacillus aquiflavi]